MANNRLYILDPKGNTAFCLAKCFGDTWFIPSVREETLVQQLDDFFANCDDDEAMWGSHDSTQLRLVAEKDLPADVKYYQFAKREEAL